MKYSYHIVLVFILSAGSLFFYAAEEVCQKLKKLQKSSTLSEISVLDVLKTVSQGSDQSQNESKKRLIQTLTLLKDTKENIDRFNLNQLVLFYLMEKKPQGEINHPIFFAIFGSLDKEAQTILNKFKKKQIGFTKEKK